MDGISYARKKKQNKTKGIAQTLINEDMPRGYKCQHEGTLIDQIWNNSIKKNSDYSLIVKHLINKTP